MQKKISTLPFKGTPEQETTLQAVIAANRHDPSRLMAVMQQAQDIYCLLYTSCAQATSRAAAVSENSGGESENSPQVGMASNRDSTTRLPCSWIIAIKSSVFSQTVAVLSLG